MSRAAKYLLFVANVLLPWVFRGAEGPAASRCWPRSKERLSEPLPWRTPAPAPLDFLTVGRCTTQNYRRHGSRISAAAKKLGQSDFCRKKNGQHRERHCAATVVAVKAIVKNFPPLLVFK